jgi:hypothetical protein
VRELLLSCVFLALVMSAPASSQEPAARPYAIAQSQIKVPGTDYHIVPGRDADIQSDASRQALLIAIETWLSIELDLPPVRPHPRIEIVPAARIVAQRYGRVLFAPDSAMISTDRSSTAAERETLAIYSDAAQTIYLPEEWTGRTPAELSILVHEIVHHVQNIRDLKYACHQERERLAYLAQERWLAIFNRSLASEFELDPLSLLVKTGCFH